jgi:hypothetical protein
MDQNRKEREGRNNEEGKRRGGRKGRTNLFRRPFQKASTGSNSSRAPYNGKGRKADRKEGRKVPEGRKGRIK